MLTAHVWSGELTTVENKYYGVLPGQKVRAMIFSLDAPGEGQTRRCLPGKWHALPTESSPPHEPAHTSAWLLGRSSLAHP